MKWKIFIQSPFCRKYFMYLTRYPGKNHSQEHKGLPLAFIHFGSKACTSLSHLLSDVILFPKRGIIKLNSRYSLWNTNVKDMYEFLRTFFWIRFYKVHSLFHIFWELDTSDFYLTNNANKKVRLVVLQTMSYCVKHIWS